jgi:hypothetical protein
VDVEITEAMPNSLRGRIALATATASPMSGLSA